MQIVRQKQNAHEVGDWLRRWGNVPGIDRVKVKSYVTWSGEIEQINTLRIAPTPQGPAVVCEKPWTSITVLWDGTVVPCNFDHDGLYPLGNVNHQTLQEIWDAEPLARLRRHHRDGDLDDIALCRGCVDKEGYPVKKFFYPLNRLQQSVTPLSYEFTPGGEADPSANRDDRSRQDKAPVSRAFAAPYRDKPLGHRVSRASRKLRRELVADHLSEADRPDGG